ncbi:MAG: hypothetical protein ABRQ37_04525 [Candidatus Eremiobacterota bacterium]
MKKVLCIIVAALFIFGLYCNAMAEEAADEKQGPEQVTELFYISMETGDVETMLTLLPEEKAEKVSTFIETAKDQDMNKTDNITICCFTTGLVKAGQAKCILNDVKTTVIESTDTSATVEITFTADTEIGAQKATEKVDDTVTLVKEGDKWVIKAIKENIK